MRAAWIASVENIDWPSKSGLSPDNQKKEFVNILDRLKSIGFNAVVVQIRPNSDAFYSSTFEPWSKFLSGKQGIAPFPYYDPLAFMIEECHKRCIEFHAWFNPYRTAKINEPDIDPLHITQRHPDWLVSYGSYRMLDPGLPQTREYIVKIVADVVRRYDIDAVHFDDYFYPYRIKGVEFNDRATFSAYPKGFKSNQREDWRRDNVSLIIKMLSDSIHAIKPYVKFGISPFGIWRNKSVDPRGSDTNGGQNYDDLYADILLWMQKGWIDYVTPQIYWHIGMKSADYRTLVKWWADNCSDVQLFIGHAAYRLDRKSKTKEWADGMELNRQIAINRANPLVSGSMFYSTKTFMRNTLGVNERIKKEFYTYPALVPSIKRMDQTAPQPPVNFRHKREGDNYVLSWEAGDASTDSSKTRYYVVYRFGSNTDLDDPANIYTITRETSITIQRRSGSDRESLKFCITALDRLYNESEPTSVVRIRL